MTTLHAEILPYGDSAYLVQYPTQEYDTLIMDSLHTLAATLEAQGQWEDLITGYTSVLACFDPETLKPDQAYRKIWNALRDNTPKPSNGQLVEIPVCYGSEYGPDLIALAERNKLSVQEVIQLHSETPYRVCMMGFIPGFTFLSEAPKALHHPRHATPRLAVPAGSIGIAGWQTGIYGLESPGGWQIIGRTPERIFDALRSNPFLLSAGDHVKFVPIEPHAFGTASLC